MNTTPATAAPVTLDAGGGGVLLLLDLCALLATLTAGTVVHVIAPTRLPRWTCPTGAI